MKEIDLMKEVDLIEAWILFLMLQMIRGKLKIDKRLLN